jgi:DNA-directed RNA polymerase subunit RPC12/RpoP
MEKDPMARTNRGWFKKGDLRIHRGRRKGSRNKPQGESPFRCPYCGHGMSKPWSRKPMRLDQIPARMKQLHRGKHRGQVRKGRRRFERGFDPARCLTGRPVGKGDSHPRVPSRCPHCSRTIEREWRPILVSRWRSRQP